MLWVNYTSLTTVYFELKLICNFVDNNFEILQHFLLSHFAIKFFITRTNNSIIFIKNGQIKRGEGGEKKKRKKKKKKNRSNKRAI